MLILSKDVDGKYLKFLGKNRPAMRYLYLRYILAYMSMDSTFKGYWISDMRTNGYLWKIPATYLRNSLVRSLARRYSVNFFPGALYEGMTFKSDFDCVTGNREDEEDMAVELDLRLKEDERRTEAKHKRDSDEESDEDEDEDIMDVLDIRMGGLFEKREIYNTSNVPVPKHTFEALNMILPRWLIDFFF